MNQVDRIAGLVHKAAADPDRSSLVAAGHIVEEPARTGRAAGRTAVLRTAVADHSSADLVDLVEMEHLVAI